MDSSREQLGGEYRSAAAQPRLPNIGTRLGVDLNGNTSTSYERRTLFSAASRVYLDPDCGGRACLVQLPYPSGDRFRRDSARIRENYPSPLACPWA